MTNDRQLYLVSLGNVKFLTWAYDRESAKRSAHYWIGGDSGTYTVTPLTNPGDRLHVAITLAI